MRRRVYVFLFCRMVLHVDDGSYFGWDVGRLRRDLYSEERDCRRAALFEDNAMGATFGETDSYENAFTHATSLCAQSKGNNNNK